MISNKKMRAGKCGELKLKIGFLATFGQPKRDARAENNAVLITAAILRRDERKPGIVGYSAPFEQHGAVLVEDRG